MEKEVGILIADLSGYSALTEAHGAHGAADIIDRFLAIIERSLVGSSHLHQRTGDEILVISETPHNLLSTTRMLLQNTQQEKNFLPLHGGLHFGKLLKRNGDYFGPAINLTSRIASCATTGKFLCSEDFKTAINTETGLFTDLGMHRFKNITGEHRVFELVVGNSDEIFIDPVCRMLVQAASAACKHPLLENVYFCSEHCMNTFERQLQS